MHDDAAQPGAERKPVLVALPLPSRPRLTWPCIAAALASSGLLWLSYFPVSFGGLAWIALVPWLMLVRAELPARRRYLFAGLAGFGFFFPALSWMRTGFTEMILFWILLALYCSGFWMGALWCLRRLDRRTRLPLALTFPLVWTAQEFARGTLMGGFSFYFLGHTQHAFLPVVQIADIGGAWAVTALIAAVNGLIAEAIARLPVVQRWFGLATPDWVTLRPQGLAVVGVLLATLAYGGWRLSHEVFGRRAASRPASAEHRANRTKRREYRRSGRSAGSGVDRRADAATDQAGGPRDEPARFGHLAGDHVSLGAERSFGVHRKMPS